MAMTGGIGYEIDQLTELGVPELMRRQSVDPQLKYALALQEATKMVEAAARERDMSQQMPMPADVVGQMETSLAKRLAPGVQQQGQRSMQMQNPPAMGLPGQAAPNLARITQGGIVGYQDGGDVMGPPEPNLYQRMGQGLKNYGTNAQESMDMLRAAKAGVGVPYEERSAAIKQVRDEIAAQKQNRDPNFIQRMGQKLMDAGLNVEESKSILKKFYDTFGKTYEEMSNGMAMGGEVKGYAGPNGSLVEEDEPFIDLGALFELIGRGTDALFSPSRATQEAREIRRGEVEQAGERGVNLLNVLPPSEGLTPEQLASFDKYDVTGAVPTKIVEERRARVESGEAARDLAQQAARRAEANAARREATPTMPQNEAGLAAMYDVRNMMPKEELTMAQKLMQLPKVKRAPATPQESGIRGLLEKAKPYASTAASIAQILGRGAGASKGFEGAKFVEESAKLRAAEQARQDEIEKAKADRTARAELLREEYGFRDKELRSKLLSESMAGERKADSDLLETIIKNIDSDPEFLQAAEEFKDTYDVIFGSYDKDKYATALAKKRQELIEKRFNDAKGQLASVVGGSSSASAMDDLAKYNI